jgi:aryl-alcohol dehydrogenase-like predicted oxidoreductase
LRLVEFLKAMGKRYDRTPGEVAIAWTLSHPVVTGAIVGFRNSKQVSGIAGALEFGPSQSEVAGIGKALQAEAAA